jgi:hypothetical protein
LPSSLVVDFTIHAPQLLQELRIDLIQLISFIEVDVCVVFGSTGLGVNAVGVSSSQRQPLSVGAPFGNVDDDILNPKATEPTCGFFAGKHFWVAGVDSVLDNLKVPPICDQLVHSFSNRLQPRPAGDCVFPNALSGKLVIV